MTVSAGTGAAIPTPATARRVVHPRRVAIAGATGTSYTPVAADDGKGLGLGDGDERGRQRRHGDRARSHHRCAAGGQGRARGRPSILGSGVETVAARADFTGENLSFAVSGAGATIDAETGR